MDNRAESASIPIETSLRGVVAGKEFIVAETPKNGSPAPPIFSSSPHRRDQQTARVSDMRTISSNAWGFASIDSQPVNHDTTLVRFDVLRSKMLLTDHMKKLPRPVVQRVGSGCSSFQRLAAFQRCLREAFPKGRRSARLETTSRSSR